MRVAALADVHGNLPALEAVLAALERERPDVVVFCGDVASGPMPAETSEVIRAIPGARFVRGNADRGVVEAYDGAEGGEMRGPFSAWCASRISRAQRDFLASFEATVELPIDGLGRVLFCHATPRNDVDVMTVESPVDRVRALLSGVDAGVVVCGHTHMQFDRTVDATRIVNPGSVGMPYGEPGAYWAMLGPDVGMRRTDYEREAAAARMRAIGSAEADAFARDNVMRVPSVDEALAVMRELELKQEKSRAR